MKILRLHQIIGILAAGIVIGTVILTVGLTFLSSDRINEAEAARSFGYEFLHSVAEGTEFYKEHSDERVLDYIQEYAAKFTHDFMAFNFDYTGGTHEFVVVYDTCNVFYFHVTRFNDKYVVSNLETGELRDTKYRD